MKSTKSNNDYERKTDRFWLALARVLDHYWTAERQDYRSCTRAEQLRHIYRDLKTLDETAVDLRRLDVHEMLARRGQVAIVWSTEDVLGVRPHLTQDQAWDVLSRCERIHDCNYGFTWDLLESVADDLYPAPACSSKENAQ